MSYGERIKKVLSGEMPSDRLPVLEWSVWWDQTVKRWEFEGMPCELGRQGLNLYFGLDEFYQMLISPGAGVLSDPYKFYELKDAILSKERFRYFEPMLQSLSKRKDKISFALLLEGFFWFPRTVFGIEPHLYAFYDDCELMHVMNSALADYNLWIIDEVQKYIKPDAMVFYEDMSYNHGPMLSKESYDEFLAPYYKKVIPRVKELGIRVFIDTDGFVEPMIPWYIECGIEGITPLERAAGVDVNRIRQNYPEFYLLGGFDKMAMPLGEEAMSAEFERILPTMKSGRYIVSVDHQTPPGVSIENYRIYVKLLKEYCEKAVK